MTEPSIDDLLLTPYEQIRFEELSSSLLAKLAVQQYEPFIATSALGQLSVRSADEGRAAAVAILEDDWDRHLTAYALTTLFSYEPGAAIDRMRMRLPSCTDPLILSAMVENVMADPTQFENADGQEFVRGLADRVRATSPEEFSDQEERSAFLAMASRS